MARDYGEKIEYDPLWRGPTASRRATDTGTFKVFLLFLLVWIGLGVYAFFLNTPNAGLKNEQAKSAKNDVKDLLEELSKSKYKIVGSVILGGLVSLVYVFMLRWCTKFIVYSVILFFWICLLAAVVHQLAIMQKLTDKKQPVAIAMVCLVVLVASVVLALIYRVKIVVTCEIVSEATLTTLAFPTHFVFPIIAYVFMIMAFILTMFTSVRFYLHDGNKLTAISGVLHFYNLIVFLWVLNFISGLKHMIFSTSFSTWYWTMDKDYVPANTVSLSVHKVSKYHLGTVALGSVVITIFSVVKAAVKSIVQTERENGLVGCLTLCFSCCCESILNFLNYVSRNAYVMSGLHGTDFFTSAKDTFNLIMRNVGMVVVTTEVASLIFWLGMLISMLGSGALCYFTTEKNEYLTVMVIVLCMILSSAIFSVFRSAVETIFVCVLEDFERNLGSEERPYYMSEKLRKLLLKH